VNGHADRTGDDLAGLEEARAFERAQCGPPGENDDHLFVGVVEVERGAVLAGIDFIKRRSQLLTAGRNAELGGAATEASIRAAVQANLASTA
jgi:hypothetical protein